ncbi:DUF6090 family protein [Gaetbulibacter aestuarii]|uniref:DUF6090 family protein n=1 Tax=Gaetbulibacter aestuarii TaxID=1502358 RepID=A0ABW7MV87_9FLAO
MIKIFKNLRQKLLQENKTVGYLKYAIGEIVLVVIGILIALQVNNWNTARKNNQSEVAYLKNLKNDLIKQKQDLKTYKIIERQYFANGEKIKNLYSETQGFEKLDSLFIWLNSMMTRITFRSSNTTFTELSSSGNLNLIHNDALKKNLVAYYQQLERFTSITEKNNTNLVDGTFDKNIFPLTIFGDQYLSNSVKLVINMDSLSQKKMDYSHFKPYISAQLKLPENQLKILNMVNLRIFISYAHVQFYDQIDRTTTALIDSINEEIKAISNHD